MRQAVLRAYRVIRTMLGTSDSSYPTWSPSSLPHRASFIVIKAFACTIWASYCSHMRRLMATLNWGKVHVFMGSLLLNHVRLDIGSSKSHRSTVLGNPKGQQERFMMILLTGCPRVLQWQQWGLQLQFRLVAALMSNNYIWLQCILERVLHAESIDWL